MTLEDLTDCFTREAGGPDWVLLRAIADRAEEQGDDVLAEGCRLCVQYGRRPWPVYRSSRRRQEHHWDTLYFSSFYPSQLPARMRAHVPGNTDEGEGWYDDWGEAVRAFARACRAVGTEGLEVREASP